MECVKVLLENFASRNIQDGMGSSPVDAACNSGHHDIAALLNDWTLGTSGQSSGPTSSNASGPLSSSSPAASGSVQSPLSSSRSPNTQSPVARHSSGMVPVSTVPQHPMPPGNHLEMPALIHADPQLYAEIPPGTRFPDGSDGKLYRVNGVDRGLYPPAAYGQLVRLPPSHMFHQQTFGYPQQSYSTCHPSRPSFLSGQWLPANARNVPSAHHLSGGSGNHAVHSFNQAYSDSSRPSEQHPHSESLTGAASVTSSTHKHPSWMPAIAVPIHPFPSPPYNTSSGKPSPQQVTLQHTAESTYLTPSPEAQSSPEGWSTESPNGHSDGGGCWSADNHSPSAGASCRVNKGFHQPAATKPLSHYPH